MTYSRSRSRRGCRGKIPATSPDRNPSAEGESLSYSDADVLSPVGPVVTPVPKSRFLPRLCPRGFSFPGFPRGSLPLLAKSRQQVRVGRLASGCLPGLAVPGRAAPHPREQRQISGQLFDCHQGLSTHGRGHRDEPYRAANVSCSLANQRHGKGRTRLDLLPFGLLRGCDIPEGEYPGAWIVCRFWGRV